MQKILGIKHNKRKGDVISFYKTDDKKNDFTDDPKLIAFTKYQELLKSTFKEQVTILGYDFDRDIASV